MVAETCEDMVLDDSRRANASFGLFLMNTVERNDRSHSMRVQQIHHSNNEGDCDSNCASDADVDFDRDCLLYTSPSPRDKRQSRMPSSA